MHAAWPFIAISIICVVAAIFERRPATATAGVIERGWTLKIVALPVIALVFVAFDIETIVPLAVLAGCLAVFAGFLASPLLLHRTSNQRVFLGKGLVVSILLLFVWKEVYGAWISDPEVIRSGHDKDAALSQMLAVLLLSLWTTVFVSTFGARFIAIRKRSSGRATVVVRYLGVALPVLTLAFLCALLLAPDVVSR